MEKMARDEYLDFLKSGNRTAHIATVNSDGSPHVVPVWFDLDGDAIVFSTGGESVKAKNFRRDSRVCISVDDPVPPYAFVKIEGNIIISEDPGEMLYWTTRIGGRYMGKENAETYGRRNAVDGEILVRVLPEKITAFKDIAGW